MLSNSDHYVMPSELHLKIRDAMATKWGTNNLYVQYTEPENQAKMAFLRDFVTKRFRLYWCSTNTAGKLTLIYLLSQKLEFNETSEVRDRPLKSGCRPNRAKYYEARFWQRHHWNDKVKRLTESTFVWPPTPWWTNHRMNQDNLHYNVQMLLVSNSLYPY